MVTTVFKTNTNMNRIIIICELREGKNKGYYVLKNNNTESSRKDEVTVAVKDYFMTLNHKK